jgi:hypothetical protein
LERGLSDGFFRLALHLADEGHDPERGMRWLCQSAFVFFFMVLALACKAAPPTENTPARLLPPSVILPDGWTVQVDLATTPQQQARGLMFVKALPADRGMLFLFETDEQRPFWMKDCFIPLDLVWLDENLTVVDISRELPPCQADPCPNYFPSRPIRNVLELQGGLAASHRLSIGDRLVVVNLPSGTLLSGGGTP